jgi:hypothetical protein
LGGAALSPTGTQRGRRIWSTGTRCASAEPGVGRSNPLSSHNPGAASFLASLGLMYASTAKG